MSLIEQLESFIHLNSYNAITFYKFDIPIVTLRVNKSGKILLITNNMKELNTHELNWNGSETELANEILNALIDDCISTERASELTFSGEMFISGRIEKDKIVITQTEVATDDEGEEYNKDVEYVIDNRGGISELTIAEIASAFVRQYLF